MIRKKSKNPDVVGAYQIARMIRNAFAHGPFSPTWSIEQDCRDQIFKVRNIIKLDTTDLHGTRFDWRHYGGPLALFRLSRFLRIHLLKDKVKARKPFPEPTNKIYQFGNLILKEVDKVPADAVPVKTTPSSDGSVHLGDGYYIRPVRRTRRSTN